MLFNTEKAREQWFSRYENTAAPLAYGSAMEHAATVNLGVFGSRDSLKRDVARVLAIEINRYRKKIKCDLETTADEVLSCGSFERAFNIARVPVENETERFVATVIQGYTPYLLKEGTLPKDLHATVSHEILSRYVRANFSEEDDE